MNPSLVLTYGNLELTKKCVESLRKQDIPVDIFIVDNGSTDETMSWIIQEGIPSIAMPTNTGFSYGVNTGLLWMFSTLREIGRASCRERV